MLKKLTLLSLILAGAALIAIQGSPAAPRQAADTSGAGIAVDDPTPGTNGESACTQESLGASGRTPAKGPDHCPGPPTCPKTLDGCPSVSCCCYQCPGSNIIKCI